MSQRADTKLKQLSTRTLEDLLIVIARAQDTYGRDIYLPVSAVLKLEVIQMLPDEARTYILNEGKELGHVD